MKFGAVIVIVGASMDTARTVGMALDRTFPGATEEAALVAELQAGSDDAFAYLLAVYQHQVFNLVSHILDNPTEAPDVLQDVFIKVYKGIGQFHGESSLKTWIYRIAVHEASNHKRGWLRRHLREAFSMDDTNSEGVVMAAEVRSQLPSPYEAFEQAERQEIVQRALACLAQPYRTAVVLRDIGGLPYDEIARVLGVAEGTVKSRLMRGRELLRRKLSWQLAR